MNKEEWNIVTCLLHHTNGYDVFIRKDKKRIRLYCNMCGKYIEFMLKEKER